jgi:hypothetical protein
MLYIPPAESPTGLDLRTGLDCMERRKILPLPGLKLRLLGCQPKASCHTDSAILVPIKNLISKKKYSDY